jgi:predicted ATPase
VDLSAISDGDIVVPDIAAAVNEPAISQLEGLIERIKGRDTLIVLDSCEHLLESVCEIGLAIVRSCPKVSLLTTSRERLRLSAEAVYGIPVLPVPSGAATSVEDALDFAC